MSAFKSFLGNIGLLSKQETNAEDEEDAAYDRRASTLDIVFE